MDGRARQRRLRDLGGGLVTAPLYRADVQLGLGLVATITIAEHDPAPPPPSGAEWARELDWPIAELRLDLPTSPDSPRLAHELRCDLRVLDVQLGEDWGRATVNQQYTPIPGVRYTLVTERAEYLDDAVTALRTRAEAGLAPLIAHVGARAARLAEREATLARGRAGRPRADDRPIEIDDTRAESAPDLNTDDSSQRFALLELDDPKPARAKRAKKAA